MIARFEGCVFERFVISSCTCGAAGGVRDQTTALHLTRSQSTAGYLRKRERHYQDTVLVSEQITCTFIRGRGSEHLQHALIRFLTLNKSIMTNVFQNFSPYLALNVYVLDWVRSWPERELPHWEAILMSWRVLSSSYHLSAGTLTSIYYCFTWRWVKWRGVTGNYININCSNVIRDNAIHGCWVIGGNIGSA